MHVSISIQISIDGALFLILALFERIFQAGYIARNYDLTLSGKTQNFQHLLK